MQSKYILIMRFEVYGLDNFLLYDEAKCIMFCGSNMICDDHKNMIKEEYEKLYCSSNKFQKFKISEEIFRECLMLDFHKLVYMKMKDIFPLIGLNEYAI